MRISWIELPERIKHELQQRAEEGNNVTAIQNEWEQILNLKLEEHQLGIQAEIFYKKLIETPSRNENEQNEPSGWNEIVLQCHLHSQAKSQFSPPLIEEKILGGWLGRSAGCLLGKPIEKITRSGSIELLSSNGTWPISEYLTAKGIPDSLLEKYPWNRHGGKESLRENIVCMAEDDDMNYPMLNLTAYERYGEGFTAEHIIQTWLELSPVLSTFTAERVAYLNRLSGIFPPQTATIRNPYREWIGAQIRADFWGWISPAQPLRAAEFAWRDSSVSHVQNGMYGEMFFAAAIAISFQQTDIRMIITEALSCIPARSRLAEAIQFVLSLPIQDQSWDVTVETLYEKYGTYHWVHTINNATLVVAALLSSKGDYERAICNVVMGGWDTDSNGATVGSIMGTILGAKKLPAKWISPLNNTIRSSLKGFDNMLLSDLAARTFKLSNY
ncbi:MAG: ADP-ribosylglycohydrolase family protein [Bacteroidota bacterium]